MAPSPEDLGPDLESRRSFLSTNIVPVGECSLQPDSDVVLSSPGRCDVLVPPGERVRPAPLERWGLPWAARNGTSSGTGEAAQADLL